MRYTRIIFALVAMLLLPTMASGLTQGISITPSADYIGQAAKDAGTTAGASGDTFVQWNDSIGTNHMTTGATGSTPIVCDGTGSNAGVLVPVGATGTLKIPATLAMNSGSWTMSMTVELFGLGVQNTLFGGGATRWFISDSGGTYVLYFNTTNTGGFTINAANTVQMPLPALRCNRQVLTLRHNHSNSTLQFFVNGVQVANVSCSGTNSNNAQILFNQNGFELGAHSVNGKYYRMTVYKALLNDADVLAQAQNRIAFWNCRTSWAKRAVLIGDSKMQGTSTGTAAMTYGQLLAEAMPDCEVYSHAIAGERAVDDVSANSYAYMTNLIQPLFDSTKNCAVIVQLGINDLGQGITGTQLWAGDGSGYLEQILSRAGSYGFKRVICTMDAGSGGVSVPTAANVLALGVLIRDGYARSAEQMVNYVDHLSMGAAGENLDLKLFDGNVHESSLGTVVKAIPMAMALERIFSGAAPVQRIGIGF